MSHLAHIECKVDCSIDQMQRALIRLMPSWAKLIEVDHSQNLKLTNYSISSDKAEGGYHIRIKGRSAGGAAELPYADCGLRRNADGSWMISSDPMSSNRIVSQLPDSVASVVQALRLEALANQIEGMDILSSITDKNGVSSVRMSIDLENFDPALLAGMDASALMGLQ